MWLNFFIDECFSRLLNNSVLGEQVLLQHLPGDTGGSCQMSHFFFMQFLTWRNIEYWNERMITFFTAFKTCIIIFHRNLNCERKTFLSVGWLFLRKLPTRSERVEPKMFIWTPRKQFWQSQRKSMADSLKNFRSKSKKIKKYFFSKYYFLQSVSLDTWNAFLTIIPKIFHPKSEFFHSESDKNYNFFGKKCSSGHLEYSFDDTAENSCSKSKNVLRNCWNNPYFLKKTFILKVFFCTGRMQNWPICRSFLFQVPMFLVAVISFC